MSLRSDTTSSKTNSKTRRSRPGYPAHAFPHRWSASDLADAIPLRLSERIGLGLVDFADTSGAANGPFAVTTASPWRHRGYLRTSALPTFIRVR